MDRSGFIIGAFAEDLEEVFEHEAVRYACETEIGDAFAAFDVCSPSDQQWFKLFGAVYLEVPTDPADPRWEELIKGPRGPKRKVANGLEKFALTSPQKAREIVEAGQGVASLVERNLEVFGVVEHEQDLGVLGIWQGTSERYLDKRLVLA